MASNQLVEPSEIAEGSPRSFLLSLIATLSVAVVPTFFAFAVLVFSQPEPKILLAVLLSLLLTAGAVVVGSALWARQPESEGLSFGDLMLWSWVRQYRAEQTLVDATATLGFDRQGNFRGHSTAPNEEQVRAIHAIAKALDAKSSYTLGHSRRVQRHARRTGEALALSKDDTDSLALAALLHDVGNVGLSDEVLRKAGRLTVEERSGIEAHVLLGARMVEMAGDPDVVDGIRHHHERWDGEGYPDQLSREQVPLFARVVAIAEAFDAMTSTRPYRESLSKQGAIGVLRAESGAQFDGDLVEIFVATLRRPVGLVERFPFLAAIGSQLREVGLVFRRVGAVALSATASTIAIALILGSTVLSPGTPTEAAPELAQRQGPAEPIDSVLGDRLKAAGDGDGMVSEIVASDGESVTPNDQVLGVQFQQDARMVATIDGGTVNIDRGTPTGPGGNGPDGNGTPPAGGGQPGPNEPGTPGGGGTNPGGGSGEAPADRGGQDKNPDGNGNGYGKDNAPGRAPERPGKSENAPGSDSAGDRAADKSEDARGQNQEEAPRQTNEEAPPRSEEAPDESEDAPERSEDAPRQDEGRQRG